MTAKILDGFGSKFAEQWVATLLTPAFVFWAGGFALLIQRWGWKNFITTIRSYPDPLQIAGIVSCFCIIAASAFVVRRFDVAVLRFLEGYGPLWIGPVRRWRIRHYRKHQQKLRQKQTKLREYEVQQSNTFQALKALIKTEGAASLSPEQRSTYIQLNEQRLTPNQQQSLIQIRQDLRALPATANLMPTRLGNLLRAAERKSLAKYGLDAVLCWPRLWMLLPDSVKKDLQTTRADLNTAVQTWLWSMLFLLWFLWILWGVAWAVLALPIGLISAWFSYEWAIAAALTYGELIEASFDLYRHLLYEALRWKLPTDPNEEHRVGQQLTEYLWRGGVSP